MKVLVVYGFHKAEKEVGEEVCSEYMRRYSPPQDLLRAMPIKNSADGENERQKEIVFHEISELIIENIPAVLIDIHHNEGHSPRKRREYEDDFLPKKVRFEDIVPPLMILYPNAIVNIPLQQCVLKQTDLGIVAAEILPGYEFEFRTPTIYGTAYIGLELELFGDGRRIHRDERYHLALENSVEFIHRIQEFVAGSTA